LKTRVFTYKQLLPGRGRKKKKEEKRNFPLTVSQKESAGEFRALSNQEKTEVILLQAMVLPNPA